MSAPTLERIADEVTVEDGPVPTALPADVDELRLVLARATEGGLRLVPSGLGSKLSWCRPEVGSGNADLLLSTRRLDAVLDYVPGDGTLTAQAGTTMAALGETVRAGGHRLTPAVPRPAEATLGGTLGAGHSGPDRLHDGPVRHHVLGMGVVLADGTLAKSGGKLVKNVTGFDLHRLYTGSRGTLCVILEASLRLFPAPDAQRALSVGGDGVEPLLEAAAELRALPASPLALVLENTLQEGWRLHLFLAGRGPQVTAEAAAARGVLGSARGLGEPEELEGGAAEERFASVRDLERPAPPSSGPSSWPWPQLRIVTRPSRIAAALSALVDGLDPRLVVQPGVAQAVAFAPQLLGAEPGRWTSLARRLAGVGARLEPLQAGPAAHLALAPNGRAPAARWMGRLAAELDPEGRLRCPTFPIRT